MIPDRYAWLVWSTAFLVPWLALYLAFPRHRRTMLLASAFTTPFGLTEPLFVPEYWNPPSLSAPGYVDRVWNVQALSGLRVGFAPLEELLFAIGFGGYWAGVYEHLTWGHPAAPSSAQGERGYGRGNDSLQLTHEGEAT